MNIAIDESPLYTGHKVRGVGFYLKNLKDALIKSDKRNNYIFFRSKNEIPENINLIHYPYFDPFSLSLPSERIDQIIVTVHDLTPLKFPKLFPSGIKGKVKWLVQRKRLQKVKAIITDSLASKEDIMSLVGVSKERVHVVCLAAPEHFVKLKSGEWQKEIRSKYKLPEKFVLYVGDATPNKNLPRLIEAIKQINIPLVMVGKAIAEPAQNPSNAWNKDLVVVQQQIKNNNLLFTLGFVPDDDLVKLYNIATCLVMPSLYEGFGLPVLEAMQSGCSVITSKEGSLPEVADNAAYFVDAYSIESIANGIKTVCEDTELQKDLSEKGIKQAKKFSWKKTAEETIMVYETIV